MFTSEATPGNIARLERMIGEVRFATDQITGNLVQVFGSHERLHIEVLALQNTIQTYIQEDRRTQTIQTAETRLVKVRQELESTFGHYGEVRRRATGMLQAVEAGLVSDETIQHTTEDVTLRTPRYWLAPALVSVAAWFRRDDEVQRAAYQRAAELDAAKTALFLALVMRRSNRADSLGWLAHYLDRQQPEELGREMVVILDSVTAGVFGAAAVDRTSAWIHEWLGHYRSRPETGEQQRDAWRDHLGLFRGSEDFAYPTLTAVSPAAPDLTRSLAEARTHLVLRSWIRELFSVQAPTGADLEERIDDILDGLVTRFDDEELPLRRQEVELQAIIANDGDTVKAKEEAEKIGRAYQQVLPLPTLLLGAALYPEHIGTSVLSQRLAISLSRDWLLDGYDALVVRARMDHPRQIPVAINTWNTVIGAGSDERALMPELERHFDAMTEREVAAERFPAVAVIVAVVAALFAAAGLAALSVGSLVFALLLAAYPGYSIWRINQARKLLKANGFERKAKAASTLRDALAEAVDYEREWIDADGEAAATRALIADLDPSGGGLAAPNP